jgi:hypothetical protein
LAARQLRPLTIEINRYAPIILLTLKCGMGNVECGMKGILQSKIRLYRKVGIDRELWPLCVKGAVCEADWGIDHRIVA